MMYERFFAIDNVCAWPNLTLLPDGSIIAAVFNQPCHGKWEGDVDCYKSTDGGASWNKCGAIAPHEPGTVRMNVGGGLTPGGDLVYIVSGWDNVKPPPHALEGQHRAVCRVLDPWVCRSSDGGATWTHTSGGVDLDRPDATGGGIVPFGNIVRAADGSLAMAMHTAASQASGQRGAAHVLRSRDDGRTWGEPIKLGDDLNETDIVALDDTRWLAASRAWKGTHLEGFISDDAGRTWRASDQLTGPSQHPAHLLKLADGRVLLTYGMRHRGLYGIAARITPDGEKWSAPIFVVRFDHPACGDGGYPACIQRDDGTIVTAFYAQATAAHQRYHVGIVRWDVDELFTVNTSAYAGF